MLRGVRVGEARNPGPKFLRRPMVVCCQECHQTGQEPKHWKHLTSPLIEAPRVQARMPRGSREDSQDEGSGSHLGHAQASLQCILRQIRSLGHR